MAETTSDAVSLADIEGELVKVQAEKEAQEERHRAAMARLEQHELQLLSAAHALRDFIEYRRTRMTEPDIVLTDPNGQVTLLQFKDGTNAPAPQLGIVGRAVAELEKRPSGHTLDTRRLIEAMERSGFTSAANDAYLSVYGTLNRAQKRPGSRIVRVGSRWGLREWYPNGVPEVNTDLETIMQEIVEEERLARANGDDGA